MYVIKECNNCATDDEENKFTIFNKTFEDYKWYIYMFMNTSKRFAMKKLIRKAIYWSINNNRKSEIWSKEWIHAVWYIFESCLTK